MRLAIVGDSVAQCVSLDFSLCFSEVIQNEQNRFDVFNFGVVGYGIPEIEVVLNEVAASQAFNAALYVVNVNDVIDAMAVLLALKRDRRDRFANYYAYVGTPVGHLKKFLIDWFKFPLVAHYYLSPYFTGEKRVVESTLPPTPTASDPKNQTAPQEAKQDCARQLEKVKHTFDKTYPILESIYADPAVQKKLVEHLKGMNERLAAKNVKFVATLFLDYYFLQAPSAIPNIVKKAAEEAGVTYLDPAETFRGWAGRCSLYTDLAHTSVEGSRIYGERLIPQLTRLIGN